MLASLTLQGTNGIPFRRTIIVWKRATCFGALQCLIKILISPLHVILLPVLSLNFSLWIPSFPFLYIPLFVQRSPVGFHRSHSPLLEVSLFLFLSS